MLYAGEDPKFIARRVVICASEDVGNADPQALILASAAAQAVHFVGMPEAQIILAQVVAYIATAPKSNAALGIFSAMKDVGHIQIKSLPPHLKDAHYKSANSLGHGIGYQYAHDFPGHYVKQQYLPDELVDKIYYEPSDEGYEAQIKKKMKKRLPDEQQPD
jgi:putative ATPase